MTAAVPALQSEAVCVLHCVVASRPTRRGVLPLLWALRKQLPGRQSLGAGTRSAAALVVNPA